MSPIPPMGSPRESLSESLFPLSEPYSAVAGGEDVSDWFREAGVIGFKLCLLTIICFIGTNPYTLPFR